MESIPDIIILFQHGIAAGYYLTFLFGGFITTAGRLARASIRPLVLPAPGAPPSRAKIIYDILGTIVTILLVNYAVAPFMLLTVSASIQSWRNLQWYGHWIVGIGLLFFYCGGSGYLKSLQKGKNSEKANGNGLQSGSSSGNTTPVAGAGPSAYPPSFDQIIPPRK
jgi:lysophospholipid acyltransferase